MDEQRAICLTVDKQPLPHHPSQHTSSHSSQHFLHTPSYTHNTANSYTLTHIRPTTPPSGGKVYDNTIGTVEFSPTDFLNTAYQYIGAERKLYVADLAIREDARRMGLATKIIKSVENYAKGHNYDEIYLHVDVGNYVARKLYNKLGFIELSQDDEHVISFTESRLQKSASAFILLKKTISPHIQIGMGDSPMQLSLQSRLYDALPTYITNRRMSATGSIGEEEEEEEEEASGAFSPYFSSGVEGDDADVTADPHSPVSAPPESITASHPSVTMFCGHKYTTGYSNEDNGGSESNNNSDDNGSNEGNDGYDSYAMSYCI